MLAKRIDAIPADGAWSFEPKWDGFRAVIFRDGNDLLIQSRDGKPLDRYFPELREPLLSQLPQQCVLDGEIVIARSGSGHNTQMGLDFDALSLRLHPATSCWPRRLRRRSSSSTSCRSTAATCRTRLFASAALSLNASAAN